MTKRDKILITGAGVLALILLATTGKASPSGGSGLSYLGQGDLPRGMRNNNPGNLKIGSSPWMGKVPVSENTDGIFEQFYLYASGLRAMIKLLRNYINAGRNSIRMILYKYAPPGVDNNDTESYIDAVVSNSGIGENDYINPDDKEVMYRLVKAMAFHENGMQAVSRDIFNEAWSML